MKTIRNIRSRYGLESFELSDLSLDELDAIIREFDPHSHLSKSEFHTTDGSKPYTLSCDFMDFKKFLSYGVKGEIKSRIIDLSNRRNKKYLDLKITLHYDQLLPGYVYLKIFILKSIRRDRVTRSLQSLGYEIEVVRVSKNA